MCDSGRTKKTLIEELQTLRSRVAELERVEAEHKKVEEKLKQYQFMVESAHDVIFFKDLKSRYVIANDKTLEAFGLPREQVIGKNDYEIMPKKAEAGKNIEDDKIVFETGKPTEITKHMTSSDGKERWFQAIKVPQFDDKGNIIGLVGIARDITALKRAEETLRESKHRQRAILDSIPDIAWLKDKKGRYIAANEPLCQAFGIKLEDLTGKTDFEISPEDLAKRYRVDDEKVMKSGKRRRVEEPWGKKDGKRIWIETIKTPIYDDKGQVVGTSGIARDITERKKMEEALRGSEEKYRLLFEGRGTDNTVISVDGVYLMMNEKGAERLGGKPEHFVGKSVYDTFPKDAADEYMKRFRHIAESGETKTYEDLVELPTGNRWFLTNVRPVKDPDGNITSIQLISQDVTEHKRVEEALRESENKYRTLLENLPQKIFLKDRNLVYVSCNENYAGDFKIKSEEIAGKTDYDFFSKKLAEKYRADDKRIIETEQTEGIEESYIQEGREVIVHTVKTPVKDAQGNVIGILGIFWDITERKRAEEAYRAIVDHSLQGFEILQDERVVFANQAMAEITGYTVEEMLAMSSQQVQAFVHPEDQALVWGRHRDRLKGKELPERYEFRGIRKDGTMCWLEIHARRIEYQGKPAVQVAYLDITERKRAEEALQKARDELEIRVEQRTADLAKANVQLRSLASELSLAEERLRRRFAMDVHDHVGQNLAISKIKIESLRESVSSPELAKGLEEIRDLISQTIESARSLTFELSPPVLYELGFEAAVEWLVRQTRQQHGLSTEFKGEGQTKPLDNDVRILLFQAVRELLVNVVKYAQAHNVTVSTRRVGNEIRVSVEDDGVGFDMSQTGSYDYKTGGFGLFSIRERLGHMGGRLEIESKPGVGTRVTLTAPIDQESQNSREGRK